MSRKFLSLQLSLVMCLTGFLANEVFAQVAEPAAKEMTAEKQANQTSDDGEYGEMSLDELAKDFKAKMSKYMQRYRRAPKAEKSKVASSIPTVAIYQSRLMEMINEDPGSEAGLKAIDWWYRRGKSKFGDVITRVILENYADLETMEKYVPQIVWHLPKKEAEQQLRMLMEVNPSDAVKGSATYLLQDLLTEKAKSLEGGEAEAVLAEAKTLQDTIREKYPDAADSSGANYVTLLDAKEFAKKLEIGKPVPDIVGTDLDGVEFKLSDYDGKVRVISYWGDW